MQNKGDRILRIATIVGLAIAVGLTVAVLVNNSSFNSRLGGPNDNTDLVVMTRQDFEKYRQFEQLVVMQDAVRQIYYGETDDKMMLDGAATGLIAGLGDPYSMYYPGNTYQKMLDADKGEYGGIGTMFSIDLEPFKCEVIRVFKGSPAEQAGIQPGDILVSVNGKRYTTMQELQSMIEELRGEKGTTVTVRLSRGGQEKEYTLARSHIVENRVDSTMLEDGIGYILLYEFAGNCAEEFEKELDGLINSGAKCVIVDLRGNPGGWVEAAVQIGDLFLDEGDLCYVKYKDGAEHHDFKTKDGHRDVSLVVLINEDSASASEILAGALRDRAQTPIVGVRSFGKGIIQAAMPIGNSGAGMQLTVGEYFTPSGYAVNGNGIEPDYKVEHQKDIVYRFADTETDPQLKKALEIARNKIAKPSAGMSGKPTGGAENDEGSGTE